MPSEGPLSGGTFASEAFTGSDVAWDNPSNAAASDDSHATADFGGAGAGETEYLKATNFGFAIPAGATIDGIVVEVERKKFDQFSLGGESTDHRVRIVKGGTVGATDKSSLDNWPDVDAYQTYGSASDLWGETWTPADINASTFGFVIAGQAGDAHLLSIDHIRITVHYTEGGGDTPLDAQPGSFAVSGVAATLQRAVSLDAQPGAIAVSGVAATLQRGVELDAQPGTFAVSGTAAGLLADRVLDVQPGSVSVTGTAAGLVADRVLNAQPGTIAVVGTDGALLAGRALNAGPGSYDVSGAVAGLQRDVSLNAAPGSVAVSGSAAGLGRSVFLAADPGAYNVAGVAAEPAIGGRMSVAGPYRIVAAQAFVPGAVARQFHLPGDVAAQAFVPGAESRQAVQN